MIKFIDILNEDIFLQNRKSPEEKAKRLAQELELECKIKFGVEVYEGDIKLTPAMLPYFKKYSKIKKVTGKFYCMNLGLTSLTEIPIPNNIVGDFVCIYNNLTTLEGAPQKVGGNFSCAKNKLTSLKGAPKEVGGYFDCADNKLTSLKGAPKYVGEFFICMNNDVKFTEKTVRKVCNVIGNVYC